MPFWVPHYVDRDTIHCDLGHFSGMLQHCGDTLRKLSPSWGHLSYALTLFSGALLCLHFHPLLSSSSVDPTASHSHTFLDPHTSYAWPPIFGLRRKNSHYVSPTSGLLVSWGLSSAILSSGPPHWITQGTSHSKFDSSSHLFFLIAFFPWTLTYN